MCEPLLRLVVMCACWKRKPYSDSTAYALVDSFQKKNCTIGKFLKSLAPSIPQIPGLIKHMEPKIGEQETISQSSFQDFS